MIGATAVAFSVAISVGASGSVSLAVGITVARNTIGDDVEASIEDAGAVTATVFGVSLLAVSDAQISATTIAATVAAAFSNSFSGSLSGAGVDSRNTVDSRTAARIDDSAVVSEQTVSIVARGTASIEATSAAVAVTASVAPVAVGLAGAGIGAYNTIQSTVEALIGFGAYVVAKGDVTVTADALGEIHAAAGSGTLSLTGGPAGGALALGIVIAANTIGGATRAEVGHVGTGQAIAARGLHRGGHGRAGDRGYRRGRYARRRRRRDRCERRRRRRGGRQHHLCRHQRADPRDLGDRLGRDGPCARQR